MKGAMLGVSILAVAALACGSGGTVGTYTLDRQAMKAAVPKAEPGGVMATLRRGQLAEIDSFAATLELRGDQSFRLHEKAGRMELTFLGDWKREKNKLHLLMKKIGDQRADFTTLFHIDGDRISGQLSARRLIFKRR